MRVTGRRQVVLQLVVLSVPAPAPNDHWYVAMPPGADDEQALSCTGLVNDSSTWSKLVSITAPVLSVESLSNPYVKLATAPLAAEAAGARAAETAPPSATSAAATRGIDIALMRVLPRGAKNLI